MYYRSHTLYQTMGNTLHKWKYFWETSWKFKEELIMPQGNVSFSRPAGLRPCRNIVGEKKREGKKERMSYFTTDFATTLSYVTCHVMLCHFMSLFTSKLSAHFARIQFTVGNFWLTYIPCRQYHDPSTNFTCCAPPVTNCWLCHWPCFQRIRLAVVWRSYTWISSIPADHFKYFIHRFYLCVWLHFFNPFVT